MSHLNFLKYLCVHSDVFLEWTFFEIFGQFSQISAIKHASLRALIGLSLWGRGEAALSQSKTNTSRALIRKSKFPNVQTRPLMQQFANYIWFWVKNCFHFKCFTSLSTSLHRVSTTYEAMFFPFILNTGGFVTSVHLCCTCWICICSKSIN